MLLDGFSNPPPGLAAEPIPTVSEQKCLGVGLGGGAEPKRSVSSIQPPPPQEGNAILVGLPHHDMQESGVY